MTATFMLVEQLAQILVQCDWTITTAESCTGGLLAAALTERAGASRYFARGYVTYANTAKTELLGVPASLIEQYGAVSAEIAEAMAEGARDAAQAETALAITGIAGPDGGTAAKPVGLVYIAAVWPGGGTVEEYRFTGNRVEIRAQARDAALRLLLGALVSSSPAP